MRSNHSLFTRAKEKYQKGGIGHLVRKSIEHAYDCLACYYCKTTKSSRTFIFQGHPYKYFYHTYNNTFRNERAVEVPIIWEMLKNHSDKKILEIGNVLSHYFPVDHDILDKYEIAPGVINQDVVDFYLSTTYDLIFSISTLEHVGYDEAPREPCKVLRAIQNLRKLLAPGGKIVFTVPVGYNTDLDTLLLRGSLDCTKRFYLRKTSKENLWIEADWGDIGHAKNDYPFPGTNGLAVGIIEAK